jgi:hypothetical protein
VRGDKDKVMMIIDHFKAWLKKPYSDDMSVTGWFAFLALISIIAFLWTRVLHLIAASLKA